MTAILYLLICFMTGIGIKKVCRIDTASLFERIAKRETDLPPVWTFDIPFALITGTTAVTTLHYFLSYVSHFIFPSDRIYPLFVSNLMIFTAFIAFITVYIIKNTDKMFPLKANISKATSAVSGYFKSTSKLYSFTVWGFVLFATYLIFYSFLVKGSVLHSGYTVFSDFAPHTAVISSFAYGDNFPTGYPHFAGDGIQYHFFFFYLCANLLYLGARFDLAMNIPSILGIVSFTTLLGSLAVLITKRKGTFLLAPLMLFLRSSYAIFDYMKELFSKPEATLLSVIKDIFATNKFIGTTVHDDWGLWAMNVYANQRHFLWGISILLIIVFTMFPSLDVELKKSRDKSIFQKVKSYFIDPDLWKITDFRRLLPALMLTALLPYWHGSVLISTLLVLFVMAFFSRERLSYLLIACTGVVFSLLFSRFFSGGAGNVVSPEFLWGFISPDKSIWGVIIYLFKVMGVSFILALLVPLYYKRREKIVFSLACLFLMLFALTVSLTPDVTVNHKYIILSMGLLNIFIADIYISLWGRVRSLWKEGPALSIISGALAIFLSFALFATGFVEFIGYRNKNANSFAVDLESPLVEWIKNNTDTEDVFLTAPYHMNAFFFSGRKVFYGWPYYTMTAGHDTDGRIEIVRDLFTGCNGNLEKFKELSSQHDIRYIIVDRTLLSDSGYVVEAAFFEMYLKKAVTFPQLGDIIIYEIAD